MPHRVLCISGSMGAGHDGAARELARRLRSDGHQVEVRDFLAAPPRPIGRVLRRSYEWELRYAAWSYELTYRIWIILPMLISPLSRFITWLSRPRIRRWIEEFDADVVVSVYPLASQALGVMRRRGQLRVPVVTYLTDFAVHPVWVHPGVDLHLAVHPNAAADAAAQTGGPARAPGPLVSPAFRERMAKRDRKEARALLGLGDDDRAVLIVAGSWGVGAVAKTFDLVARSPDFVPVVVCGREERLRRRLARTGTGTVIGWTDQMPTLMAACDVLIENAGGLTSLEAMAAGLPVVTYRPIPGHGRANTRLMHEAGVARRADDHEQLRAALDELSQRGLTRRRQIAAAHRMWAGDAAADVVALADAVPAVRPVVVPLHRRPARIAARVAVIAAVVTVAPIAVNTGVGIAAANGIGVAHPMRGGSRREVVYLAARLDPAEVQDLAVVDQLERLHATAVIDQETAETEPDAVRALAARGVDVENGGSGERIEPPWRRAASDVVESRRFVQSLTGEPVRMYVPRRRIDGVGYVACRRARSRVVIARRLNAHVRLVPGRTYLVEGFGFRPGDVRQQLQQVEAGLNAAHLDGAPFAGLH